MGLRRISANRLLAVLCIAGGIAATAIVAYGAISEASRESRYEIYTRGFKIGELKTVMEPVVNSGRRQIRFRSSNSISAGFLFFSHKSTSREEALIGENGTEGYRYTGTVNGRSREVTGRFSANRVDLDVREDGTHKSIVIPRNSFDFTTMDCPEMVTLNRIGDRSVMRLLDLENARVVLRKYEWVRTEQLNAGNRSFKYRVIDFEDPENRCRRWITRDDRGVIIARQEGSGKTGAYLLKMTGLAETPANR